MPASFRAIPNRTHQRTDCDRPSNAPAPRVCSTRYIRKRSLLVPLAIPARLPLACILLGLPRTQAYSSDSSRVEEYFLVGEADHGNCGCNWRTWGEWGGREWGGRGGGGAGRGAAGGGDSVRGGRLRAAAVRGPVAAPAGAVRQQALLGQLLHGALLARVRGEWRVVASGGREHGRRSRLQVTAPVAGGRQSPTSCSHVLTRQIVGRDYFISWRPAGTIQVTGSQE
jgi:hypothetical protein